jgi:hypothetical protein
MKRNLLLILLLSVCLPYAGDVAADERQALSVTSNVDNPDSPNQPVAPGSYKTYLAQVCPICAALPSNFIVGISDTGLDGGPLGAQHADLAGREMWGANFTTSPDADDVGHGTMIAGIIAGDNATLRKDHDASGSTAGGYYMGTGIAPSARIYSTRTRTANAGGVTNTSPFSWIHDAASHGAAVQNHSFNMYFQAQEGRYTELSRDYDLAVRDSNGPSAAGGLPITLTVAAGNREGYPNRDWALPPGTAKNVISVGGTENYRNSPDEPQPHCHNTLAGGYRNLMPGRCASH